jgi:hypothetical protein
MVLVAGGKLGTEGSRRAEYARGLLEAGFDHVFTGPSCLDEMAALLAEMARSLPAPEPTPDELSRSA